MPPSLLPEIWLKVFSHLARPLPLPQQPNLNNRSCLRQPDLLACLLVSKEWYNLASPTLYLRVVTDRIPSFLSGFTNPIIPGITSKRELLGLVQQLFVEYTHEELDPNIADITYTDLLEYGLFHDLTDEDWGSVNRRDFPGLREACELARPWRSLLTKDGRSRHILNNLHTVATGAFFGEQMGFWSSMNKRGTQGEYEYTPTFDIRRDIGSRYYEWRDAVHVAQRRLFEFISKTSSVKHFCQAVPEGGALAIGREHLFAEAGGATPTIAAHDLHGGHIPPVVLGTRTRHYVHTGSKDLTVRDSEWASICNALVKRGGATAAQALPDRSRCALNVECYLPARGKDVWWGRNTEENVRMLAKHSAPGSCGLQPGVITDEDRWEVSHIAPPCDACGWSLEI